MAFCFIHLNPKRYLVKMSYSSLALYIHFPFCVSKCPYCDFNSYAIEEKLNFSKWEQAYIQQLQWWHKKIGPKHMVSIFFGGGTPSLMPPQMVYTLLETAKSLWSFSPSIEITLEMNPSSVTHKKLEALCKAGINRVSIGVQSLNEETLKFLGRTHSVQEAKEAVFLSHALFKEISMDLIYGHPFHRTTTSWLKELDQALEIGGNHFSLYQLVYTPGTPLTCRLQNKEFITLSETQLIALYSATEKKMKASGLNCYEISNYAKIGKESRHNLVYWRLEDYLGIGPGAHSRLTIKDNRIALCQFSHPIQWLAAENGKTDLYEPLSEEQCFHEMLLMGLRLHEGIAVIKLMPFLKNQLLQQKFFSKVTTLQTENFLVKDSKTLKIADDAFIHLESIIRFLAL